jgi:hypothetical protein
MAVVKVIAGRFGAADRPAALRSDLRQQRFALLQKLVFECVCCKGVHQFTCLFVMAPSCAAPGLAFLTLVNKAAITGAPAGTILRNSNSGLSP